MKFADRLKQYRENRGFTQVELGKLSGISSRMIQRYEYGISKPRIDASEKLAKALDITVNELLGTDGMLIAEAREKSGSKSARDIESLVNEVTGLFAGGELPEEDKDALMQAFSAAYFKSKEENKKYTPKKYQK